MGVVAGGEEVKARRVHYGLHIDVSARCFFFTRPLQGAPTASWSSKRPLYCTVLDVLPMNVLVVGGNGFIGDFFRFPSATRAELTTPLARHP